MSSAMPLPGQEELRTKIIKEKYKVPDRTVDGNDRTAATRCGA
jgi:hypothetical protein